MNGVGHLHVEPDGTLSGKVGDQVRVAVSAVAGQVQIASATYGKRAIPLHRESELTFASRRGHSHLRWGSLHRAPMRRSPWTKSGRAVAGIVSSSKHTLPTLRCLRW